MADWSYRARSKWSQAYQSSKYNSYEVSRVYHRLDILLALLKADLLHDPVVNNITLKMNKLGSLSCSTIKLTSNIDANTAIPKEL